MNYIYVTLVTTKNYIRGAEFLQESLKKVNAKYPLLVLITENLQNEDLSRLDNIKIVPLYLLKGLEFHRYGSTINKFQIFNLIEYKKVIFLDADMFLFKNIDFIFENYASYEFLYSSLYTTQRVDPPEELPYGNLLLVTPNKEIFPFVLFHRAHPKAKDDEHIIKYILYPDIFVNKNENDKITSFDKLGIQIQKRHYYAHDSGPQKYFNHINISAKEFAEKDLSFIKYFFLAWQERKSNF